MFSSITRFRIRCIFRLGTPLRGYVVIENVMTNQLTIFQISDDLYEFLLAAGIPVCDPTTAPPASLADLQVQCVFRIFIGAQEPIPYALGENINTGETEIIQITDAAFTFFRFIGVPICPIVTVPSQA